MKQLQNIIIISLCTTVLGFFANWAQNDYSYTILSVSMLACAVALFIKGFFIIKPLKIISIIYGLIALFSIIIPIGHFLKLNFEELILYSFLLLLISVTILPLIIIFIHRKKELSINLFNFYFAECAAILCLGSVYCLTNLPGDFMILPLASLLLLPLLFKSIMHLFKSVKNYEVLEILPATMYLFLSTNLLALILGIMHWPGSKHFTIISLTLISILIIIFLLNPKKKDVIFHLWKSQLWLSKTTTICLIITSAWYVLNMNNQAPSMYSSDIPPSMNELIEKENSFTKEGKAYAARLETFRKNYSQFIQNRKAAEKQ